MTNRGVFTGCPLPCFVDMRRSVFGESSEIGLSSEVLRCFLPGYVSGFLMS